MLFLPGFRSSVLFTLLNEVTEVTRRGRGRRSPACMCSGVLRPCKTKRDPHAPRCHPNGTSPRGHLLPGPCTKPLPLPPSPAKPGQARREEAPLRGAESKHPPQPERDCFLGKHLPALFALASKGPSFPLLFAKLISSETGGGVTAHKTGASLPAASPSPRGAGAAPALPGSSHSPAPLLCC